MIYHISQNTGNSIAYLWKNVPEKILFYSGYINSFNEQRLKRLAAKKDESQTKYRDFGLDGILVVFPDEYAQSELYEKDTDAILEKATYFGL
jgi:hypothetical protein